MAIVVGLVVGLAIRLCGKGNQSFFSMTGVVMGTLGCLAGNLLSISIVQAHLFKLPLVQYMQRLDLATAIRMLRADFDPSDYRMLIFGFAMVIIMIWRPRGLVSTRTPSLLLATLMFRLGNERANLIMEAQLRVSLVRTERTLEGMLFYRIYELPLVRDRSQALSRSWTAMHTITSTSPLYHQSPASLKETEVELMVSVSGVDDTSLQPVHARRRYEEHEIIWGARHEDVLTEDSDGNLVLDIRRFHDIHPTEPFEGFPYPAAPTTSATPPTRE